MKFRTTLLVTLLALTPLAFARDAHYDGSDPLLCTVMTGEICDIRGCEHADRQDDLGGIKHLVVDFKRDRIKSPQGGVSATIKQQSQVDNRLFLQGLSEREDADEDDARSWTMTIADPTGTMTLTVAGEEIALVMFGSCAPVE
jgi:hypothetical protein